MLMYIRQKLREFGALLGTALSGCDVKLELTIGLQNSPLVAVGDGGVPVFSRLQSGVIE